MKKLLLKNKELSLTIKLISALSAALLFFAVAYGQELSDKTEITGEELVVEKGGDVIISRGNSKAVSGDYVLTSREMRFNRKTNEVSAKGAVKLKSKTENNEPITATGKNALYNTQTGEGKFWGDVEIVTSSGTIFSDKAQVDAKTKSMTVSSETKRPVADTVYDNRKGLFEADTMTYYHSEDNKKIVMKGSVKGKIEMEDKIK